MPELRAPENRRTGIEIKPKVKYPDQTEAAIVSFLLPEQDLVFGPLWAKF
jgi:hypothetical protein